MRTRSRGRGWAHGLVAFAALLLSLAAGAPLSAEASGATAEGGSAAKDESAPKGELAPVKTTDEKPNGFDVSNATVPRDRIIEGGPPRDGIPIVDAPRYVPPEEATRWVEDQHAVIGVIIHDDARAFPVHVMEFHELVNDTIGGRKIVLTYDPLTDVAKAWSRKVDGKTLHFGISGLVYRVGFLMYDKETESLWVPFDGRAISGPLAGKHLERIPTRTELLGFWRRRYPQTGVLTLPDPEHIDYRYSRYSAYWISNSVPFPLEHEDKRYHPKELVLGVEVNGRHRAYLGSILTHSGGRIVDEIEGYKVRIEYDSDFGAFEWDIPDAVHVTTGYWFAWKNQHPDTEIWHDESAEPPSEK